MAKGGKAPTEQTVTQTNLPKYAEPYYTSMMGQAQALTDTTKNPYQPFQGERIADFTPQQQVLQQNILGMQTPKQFGMATETGATAARNLEEAGKYTPGQFTYERAALPGLNYFQMQGPRQFGGLEAAQYMSPFIQQALEPQVREAIYGAKRGQLAEDLGAARRGTYGGSRQLLASMERERNLGQQLGDIQARGLQAAYESAQTQFERDRAAEQSARQANLQAQLGVQGLEAQYGTQMQLANQQAALDVQRAAEQSRQFGSGQQLAAAQAQAQAAQTMANIAQMQGQADLARLGMQQGTAAQAQSLNQQYLDTQYQDFLRQQQYPMQQLQQYSALMRGMEPPSFDVTKSTYTPAQSVGSQIMQAGLGGLSMARMAGGI